MATELNELIEQARKLPAEDRRRLAARLLEEIASEERPSTDEIAKNLAIVDELFGSLKGLSKETIAWLAEDEELSGY